MSSAAIVTRKMQGLANKKLASAQQGFYQTQPGGYGAGDKFLGISVPHSRKVAKEYKELSLSEIKRLSTSPFHEIRFVALAILVIQFRAAKNQIVRKRLYETYISMVKGGGIVNNWDLVDVTAPTLGEYLLQLEDPMAVLNKLAKSKSLWERRVSVVFTFAFLRAGDLEPTYEMAERHLGDKHDLMHKAVGWLLREMGKRDPGLLRAFLQEHCTEMPRTALRYSIEKFSESERRKWLLTK